MECRQGWRYFWILLDACGLRPCSGPTLKRLCVVLVRCWDEEQIKIAPYMVLKILYDDFISAIDDCFNQWDPRTVAQMKEVSGLQGELKQNKKPSFGFITCEHLRQLLNCSVDPRINLISPLWVGCNTRSVFKLSTVSLKSVFAKAEESNISYLPINREKKDGFMSFARVFPSREAQRALSKILTLFAKSITSNVKSLSLSVFLYFFLSLSLSSFSLSVFLSLTFFLSLSLCHMHTDIHPCYNEKPTNCLPSRLAL